MSEQTIKEKSQEIQNETGKYANTRGRVGAVLDDINDTKANKDASGFSEENKVAWKEALGVGELPDNLAKIDKEGEEGNTYTKEQVNDLLDEKLATPTEEGTTAMHPYVVGVDAEGNSVKLPAGDLGKNTANSKLTSVAGAGLVFGNIWSIKTNGFPFRIEGLPNETGSPIPAGKVMVREDGTIVVDKEPDVVFQMPQNATITVNHIYPTQMRERPSYADAIVAAFERAKGKTFTIWRKSDFELIDNDQPIDSFVTFNENGFMLLNAKNLPDGVDRLKIFSVREFSDTDSFQIRLEVKSFYDFAYHGMNIFTGIGYRLLEDVTASAYTSQYDSFFNLGNGTRNNVTIFFTKIDNIVYISGYYMQSSFSKVVSLNTELGDAIFKVVMAKNCTGNIRVSYKDLNS